jgi:hypothetical protein
MSRVNGDKSRGLHYPADLRPRWKRIIEAPFRAIGVIKYEPFTMIPIEEVDKFEYRKDDI